MKESKYPSKETIDKLTSDLGLVGADKYTQDWEYEEIIEYWSCGEEELENCFAITPFIREIKMEHSIKDR